MTEPLLPADVTRVPRHAGVPAICQPISCRPLVEMECCPEAVGSDALTRTAEDQNAWQGRAAVSPAISPGLCRLPTTNRAQPSCTSIALMHPRFAPAEPSSAFNHPSAISASPPISNHMATKPTGDADASAITGDWDRGLDTAKGMFGCRGLPADLNEGWGAAGVCHSEGQPRESSSSPPKPTMERPRRGPDAESGPVHTAAGPRRGQQDGAGMGSGPVVSTAHSPDALPLHLQYTACAMNYPFPIPKSFTSASNGGGQRLLMASGSLQNGGTASEAVVRGCDTVGAKAVGTPLSASGPPSGPLASCLSLSDGQSPAVDGILPAPTRQQERQTSTPIAPAILLASYCPPTNRPTSPSISRNQPSSAVSSRPASSAHQLTVPRNTLVDFTLLTSSAPQSPTTTSGSPAQPPQPPPSLRHSPHPFTNLAARCQPLSTPSDPLQSSPALPNSALDAAKPGTPRVTSGSSPAIPTVHAILDVLAGRHRGSGSELGMSWDREWKRVEGERPFSPSPSMSGPYSHSHSTSFGQRAGPS